MLKGEKGDDGEDGESFDYESLTPEQKEEIRGEQGEQGDPFTYDDFTPAQLEDLKGEKGDDGESFDYDSLTPEQKEEIKGEQGEAGEDGVTSYIKKSEWTYDVDKNHSDIGVVSLESEDLLQTTNTLRLSKYDNDDALHLWDTIIPTNMIDLDFQPKKDGSLPSTKAVDDIYASYVIKEIDLSNSDFVEFEVELTKGKGVAFDDSNVLVTIYKDGGAFGDYVLRPPEVLRNNKWLTYREDAENLTREWKLLTTDLVSAQTDVIARKLDIPIEEAELLENQLDINHYLYNKVKNSTVLSDAPPDNPIHGNMWFDNEQDKMALRIYDEASEAYISVAPPVAIEGKVYDLIKENLDTKKQVFALQQRLTTLEQRLTKGDKV